MKNLKLTLTPTEQLLLVDGAMTRVWKGVTADGVECFALVARVTVHNDQDASAFDACLTRTAVPEGMPPIDFRKL